MKVEFIKFGNAVSVNGTNMNSANSKDFFIERESEFVFAVASKRAPNVVTKIALTNVSEWREEKSSEEKTVAAKKSKTNS